MATGWSNYQVTQGYMEWFYYVKFAVVSAIAAGFAWFCIGRMIHGVKGAPPPKKTGKGGAPDGPDDASSTG